MAARVLATQTLGQPVPVQLTELNLERNKMNTEKVNLENQLEAEQEYILNKLHKQVCVSIAVLLLSSV